MINKIKFMLPAVIIFFMILTVGCTKNTDLKSTKELESTKDMIDNAQVTKDDSIESGKVEELTFWTWYGNDEFIKDFEANNPDIKIKTQLIDYNKCKEEYMKALTSGDGPDVMMFSSDFFGDFTVNGVLQNLLEEPCKAGKYQKDFPGWNSGLSVDNKQLLSLAHNTSPKVTLYRADIMKENGFPSEPEEMGKFLENPDNILAIATKLKAQDKYIFQWPTDLPDVVGACMGYFDKDLNYTRYGDTLIKTLDIAKKAHKAGMEIQGSYWTENGKDAIKEGKLVMQFNMSSYFPRDLEKLVPEQKGLWRMTKPPLGVASWAYDTRIAMNAQSTHKEKAWRFIESLVTFKLTNRTDIHTIPEYLPARPNGQKISEKDAYLGGQDIATLLYDLGSKMVPYKLTPMDTKVSKMFTDGVWLVMSKSMDSAEGLKKIKADVDKQFSEEKKEYIN